MPSLKELGIENVIDSHTHSGGTDTYNFFMGNIPHSQAVEDLELKAKLSGVNKVITTPFPGTSYFNAKVLVTEGRKEPSGQQDFPYQQENFVLVNDSKRFEIIIPFACVDPTTKVPEQLAFIGALHDRKEVFGLKFHSLACGCTAFQIARSGIADFAIERNIPILVHSGLDQLSHPRNVIKLSETFPNLRVCLAHLGGLDEETIKAVSKHRNVFIDCVPFLQICRAVEEGSDIVSFPNLIDPQHPAVSLNRYFNNLKDHLIWGTDEPWTTSINANGKVRSKNSYFDEVNILTELFKISPDAVSSITYKNTINYLYG
jgi:hypothetical protein